MHLMLDCYGCPRDKLADWEFVLNILETLPSKIGAAKIAPPQVFKYHGEQAEEWGLSGVVMVDRSHFSLHTFPDKEHVFVDVFSSEDFNLNFLREEILRSFGATSHKEKVLCQSATQTVGQFVEPLRIVN